MDACFSVLAKFHTKESVDNGLSFVPGKKDVFVTTYPKCGTTWVSFIAHSLRSRGSVDFEEISQVVPWTLVALDCSLDLNATQVASPRVFKSHEIYKDLPKGGKCIYVLRNPLDVCVSFYFFLLSFCQMSTDDTTLEEFVDRLFVGQGSNSGKIWDHFFSFYEHREDPTILWIFYEDLLEHREKCIEKIADFMEIPLDDELRQTVLEQSSFGYMKEHGHKFDEHWVYDRCKERMGFSKDSKMSVGKVSTGGVRRGVLTEELKDRLLLQWTKVFASTGLNSYEDLRQHMSPFNSASAST